MSPSRSDTVVMLRALLRTSPARAAPARQRLRLPFRSGALARLRDPFAALPIPDLDVRQPHQFARGRIHRQNGMQEHSAQIAASAHRPEPLLALRPPPFFQPGVPEPSQPRTSPNPPNPSTPSATESASPTDSELRSAHNKKMCACDSRESGGDKAAGSKLAEAERYAHAAPPRAARIPSRRNSGMM